MSEWRCPLGPRIEEKDCLERQGGRRRRPQKEAGDNDGWKGVKRRLAVHMREEVIAGQVVVTFNEDPNLDPSR